MKKLIVSSTLVSAMILAPVTVFGSTDVSMPASNEVLATEESQSTPSVAITEISSVDEVLTNDFFKDLPKPEKADIEFYRQIEEFKKANPSLSNEQVISHFDEMFGSQKGFQAQASYTLPIAEWQVMNQSEKKLVVLHPGKALITKTTKELAFKYTETNYGFNGEGDPSDAFRHGIWNLLMCKYVDVFWAEQYSTAHEEMSAQELKEVRPDGYSKAHHQRMDLHNNKQGRDSWKFIDTINIPDDGELQNRIIAKIKAKQMVILHS